MYEIKEVQSKEEWNRYVSSSAHFNFFSLFEWGEYKSTSWTLQRLAIFKNGSFIGATQVLYKQRLGIFFGWAPGGLVLKNWKNLKEVLEQFQQWLKSNYFLYHLRFNIFDNRTGISSFHMDSQKIMTPALHSLNSGYTIRLNLEDLENPRKSMSSNGRYYLKSSESHGFDFKELKKVDVDSFIRVHNEMTNQKGLQDIEISHSEINTLAEAMNPYLKMYVTEYNGNITSACLVFEKGKSAYYYLAATTNYGREHFASFKMVFELIKYLKESHFEEFDFSGITPFKEAAKGVNRFKMGFGGEVVRYIGEWDISSNKLINWFFNLLLKFKS